MDDLVLPLQQSEAFERTCQQVGIGVTRVTTDLGTCLIQTRSLPVIGPVHLISRGPVTHGPGAEHQVLRAAKSELRGPLIVNAPTEAEKPGGLKIAGGADMAILQVTDPDRMRGRLHQKWRNQLKKAERCDLRIVDQPLQAGRHDWFFKQEAAQQKQRGYKTFPAGLLLAYAGINKGQARLYVALQGEQPVAAMLVLKHGRMATYQAGVTTEAGRRTCAHNLLLWRIMTDLQRRGFAALDLGRADLNSGLTRFKRGTGADIETLAGSFLLHPRFISRPSMDSRHTGMVNGDICVKVIQ
ncbi:MAG: GNAT family N-acetyltransferase [Pseudomonadota bacterium]